VIGITSTSTYEAMAAPQVESASIQRQIADYLHVSRSASKARMIVDLTDTEGVLPDQTSSARVKSEVTEATEPVYGIENVDAVDGLRQPGVRSKTLSRSSSDQALPTPLSIKTELDDTDNTLSQPDLLPHHLIDQIDDWYDRNPGKPPPFSTTCNSNTFSAYGNTSNSRCVYWHKSGKILDVAVYDLPTNLFPQNLNRVTCKRLLVAKGDAIAPFIIHHASFGYVAWHQAKGTIYKAWVGLDRPNEDGFEFDPSVLKVAETQTPEGMSTTERERSTSKEPLLYTRSLRTNVKAPARYGSLVSWASLKRKNPDSNLNDEQDNLDGEALLASFMAPTANAEFAEDTEISSPSTANGKLKTRKQRSDKGTVKPPKEKPPKEKPPKEKPPKEKPPKEKPPKEKPPKKKPPKKKVRLEPAPDTTEFLGLTHSPITGAMKSQSQPATLISNSLRHIEARASFQMTTSAERTFIIPRRNADFAPASSISQPESRYGANITVQFHPHTSSVSPKPLRSRPFDMCDSVCKLFAQASAGRVFGGHGFDQLAASRKIKVLALRINNRDHELPVVEEDEEDFQAFVSALDGVRGTCLVDVRAILP
jgi:hypothetical protein